MARPLNVAGGKKNNRNRGGVEPVAQREKKAVDQGIGRISGGLGKPEKGKTQKTNPGRGQD